MTSTCKNLILTLLALFAGYSTLHAGIAILNGLSHEVQLSPGENVRGNIQIQNTSAKEISMKLYQTDYWFSHTGESKYDEKISNARSNASWVTLSQVFLTLQPNETRSVDFEIKVPQNDSLKGTYWSVVMVEGMAPPDTATTKKGVSISTVTRYAVQIITHIGDTGISDLQFLNVAMKKEGNATTVDVDLQNTGDRALRPEVGLELFDAGGISQGIIKCERKRIYPGTSTRFTLNIVGIKPGSYSGVLVADCDEDHIFATKMTLEL